MIVVMWERVLPPICSSVIILMVARLIRSVIRSILSISLIVVSVSVISLIIPLL